MAGNRAGALKARDTNRRNHGPDFYKEIGGKSWKNPERSRKTGFALNPELAKEAGRTGGKKTKNEYKAKNDVVYTKGDGSKVGDTFTIKGEEFKVALVEEIEWTTAEELRELISPEEIDSGSL